MEKAIVFALLLVNVQLVVGTCSSEIMGACSSGYNACINAAGTSSDELCNCFGAYSICLLNNNCIDATAFQTLVGNCEASGCTAQQCSGSVLAPVDAPYAPITSAPFTQSGCDITTCIDNYYTCTNSSTEGYCPCHGEYLSCVYFVGCINQSEYQSAIQSCEQRGCTARQCLDQNAPTNNSPVSGTPVASPFNAPVSGCSAAQATLCANEYQSCVQEAGADVNAICNCYGPYFMCLYDFGCLTVNQYQSLVQSCAQSGCTLQQCEGNNTVIAPTSSTPSSSSTPVGAPVNAPFAPPATVSCLQPWELVLIVVGSVLAGIGLAAIVGVIIYLSRRSSAKKTSTKYAKLQNY